MHDGVVDSSRNTPYMLNNRWDGHQRFPGHTASNCNLNGQDENSTFLMVSKDLAIHKHIYSGYVRICCSVLTTHLQRH